MGATHDGGFGRAVSRIPLLLLVALLAVLIGAVPVSRAGAAQKTPPGDPPGNNGTVKIDQSDVPDEDKGNEPIGDNCIFWLKFYGFDQGQRADITFAAHPPTGGKDPITDRGNGFGQPGPGVLISDDPAGGGQDEDAVVGYNLTDYVKDLTPQAQHGYHIKLTTTIHNADGSDVPGGVKHKVFWIKCTPAPATTLRISKALEGSGAGPFSFDLRCNHRVLDRTFTLQAGEKLDVTDVPPGTVCVVSETDAKGAQATRIVEDPPHGKADDGEVKVQAGTATIVKFTNVFPGAGSTPAPSDTDLRPASGGTAAGSGGTTGGSAGTAGTTGAPGTVSTGSEVLGETATRPQATTTLPRTGTGVRPLAATGLWSLAAGGLALVAGRRRRPA
jgi:LPXTG-motif cell wall-anchored protein